MSQSVGQDSRQLTSDEERANSRASLEPSAGGQRKAAGASSPVTIKERKAKVGIGSGCLVVFLVLVLIWAAARSCSSSNVSVQPTQSGTDVGVVEGVGKEVLTRELSEWKAIGLVERYEVYEVRVVVYLNHSDWVGLPGETQADFKAGIRAYWPDGSVVFRDSKTGEQL